jgi:hypothetical protein
MGADAKRATRELVARIELSLDEEEEVGNLHVSRPGPPAGADSLAEVAAQQSRLEGAQPALGRGGHAGRRPAGTPLLCTQLKAGGGDDRPAPGWVPCSVQEDTAPAPDAGQGDARRLSQKSGYWDTAHTPRVITDTHRELLDMTAGESRRQTVERVLRSRERLLKPASTVHTLPSCHEWNEDVQHSTCRPASGSLDVKAIIPTPRLLHDVEFESQKQARERLLTSRAGCSGMKGSNNVEDALAQRPWSSVEEGKDWRMRPQVWQSFKTTRPAVRAYNQRSHPATSHDVERESWLTAMSRTFRLGVGDELRMLVEAFDKPEGVNTVHKRNKRASLRSASWKG